MTTGRRSKSTDATIFPSAAEAEGEGEDDELKPQAHRSERRWMLADDRGSMVWVGPQERRRRVGGRREKKNPA
jgi:hypothetical protein